MTPADFAKLNELRLAQADEDSKRSGGGSSALRRKIAELQTSADDASQALVSEREIMGVRKKAKMTHEERMASIQEGREGREKFGSNKHRKLSEKAHSTTNEEKRRKKAFAMVAASRSVRSKVRARLYRRPPLSVAHGASNGSFGCTEISVVGREEQAVARPY